jgi:hypothetical protein
MYLPLRILDSVLPLDCLLSIQRKRAGVIHSRIGLWLKLVVCKVERFIIHPNTKWILFSL